MLSPINTYYFEERTPYSKLIILFLLVGRITLIERLNRDTPFRYVFLILLFTRRCNAWQQMTKNKTKENDIRFLVRKTERRWLHRATGNSLPNENKVGVFDYRYGNPRMFIRTLTSLRTPMFIWFWCADKGWNGRMYPFYPLAVILSQLR